MRILQISSARHFGGGERHIVDLTNGLIERGHELFVAAVAKSPILPELPTGISRNFFELSASNALNYTKAFALRSFVRAHDIEIVHAHMARDYPLSALAVGGAARVRFVITRHVLFPMNKLHRITRGRVARVIAVSQSVAASVRAQGIFRDDQIVVVPNGIDIRRFSSRVNDASSARLRVGILGELTPNKGQIEFVRAAEMVARQVNDVKFIIAGRDNSNEGAYGRQLKEIIQASEFRDRIELVEGEIDVPGFLTTLDLLVSASRSEAFGLSVVEAMAAGVPVVATATDGAREIIKDKETGHLVRIGDVREIAATITGLLRNREARQRVSAHARRMVAQRFSLERMVSETEAVYSAGRVDE
jgi:glycosyltransferase involved in cell wall biosynthesis